VLLPLLGACLAAAGIVMGVGAAPSQAAPKCPDPGIDKAISRADVVFRGQVAKVRPVRSGAGGQKSRTYIVDVDRVYKSSLVTHRVAVTALVGTRCALPPLDQGTRYIFFVTEHQSRLVATNATAKATPRLTHQVVARLGNGAQPQEPPPPAAEFTKVADAAPPALSRLLAPGAALVIVSLLGLLVLARLGRRTA
jgi:hypothetical protein